MQPGQPLLRSIGIVDTATANSRTILEGIDPVTFLLVGSRQAPAGRPPQMSVFNVFFDSPANRPFQTYHSRLELKHVRVTSQGHRADPGDRRGHARLVPGRAASYDLRAEPPRSCRNRHPYHRRIAGRSCTTPVWHCRNPARRRVSPGWTPKGNSTAMSRPRTPGTATWPSGIAH